jgi:hypothetical protein
MSKVLPGSMNIAAGNSEPSVGKGVNWGHSKRFEHLERLNLFDEGFTILACCNRPPIRLLQLISVFSS